jgi:hypothetical protein
MKRENARDQSKGEIHSRMKNTKLTTTNKKRIAVLFEMDDKAMENKSNFMSIF